MSLFFFYYSVTAHLNYLNVSFKDGKENSYLKKLYDLNGDAWKFFAGHTWIVYIFFIFFSFFDLNFCVFVQVW